MNYDYSENILVQEAAGHLLETELGWEVKFAYNTEVLGENGTFGRKSYKDILLTRYFRQALKTLNPWITPMQMDEAQKKMESRLSTASLMQINEEKYGYIRDGIPVTVKKPGGRSEIKRAMVVDFQHPGDQSRNHFLAIKELKIHGDYYRRRTDIVGFLNGIPLLFVELKKNTVDVQNAYDDNYTDYLDTIPHLFYYNAFLMVEINHIVNDYVEVQPQQEGMIASKRFDISDIDFGLLVKEFSKHKKQNLVMRDLQQLIQDRLNHMLITNPQRIDYLQRYQQIIAEYNGEQDRATIEKTFMELMDLANSMDEEQQRYVREGFSSDEELSVYDLLFSDNLSRKDIQAIKKVAVDVLAKVKSKIAELDHWTDKQETRATVDNLIRDTLWEELPECYDELSISGYRQKIYEYVYTRYKEAA